MEIHNLIETGNKLEMLKISRTAFEEELPYVSRFLYKRSDREAVIEMPASQGRLVALEIGSAYMVTFFTNKGLYKCQVEVVERFYEETLPVAVVKFQSAFEKLQRRQYYRMECLINLTFRVVTKEETERIIFAKRNPFANQTMNEEESSTQRNYDGVALDISGGGVRFNSNYQVEPGKIIVLQIAFETPDAQKLQFLFARVLRSTNVPNRSGLFEHRVEFVLISNDERERIIRYIFLEERNRRKKNS